MYIIFAYGFRFIYILFNLQKGTLRISTPDFSQMQKLYNSKNPFPFMDTISMIGKVNFFEARPTEYQSSRNEVNNKALSNLVISDDF